MDTDITATPGVLFIDVGAGITSGTATIEYKSSGPIVLWQRLNLGSWIKINLFTLVGTADADEIGTFVTPALRPGDLLEYRSYYYSHVDPNGPISERDQFVQAQVQALVSTPSEQPWITDQSTDVGGTYYQRLVATPPLFTTIHAEIGIGKPLQGPTGLQILPAVVATADSVLQKVHKMALLPLLAGTDYFCTLRINNQQGEWFTLVEELTTLLRTVTVDLEWLFINNDGDGGGTGEAEFWVTTFEGENQIDQLNLGDDEYDILSGTSISVSRQIVRGPTAVTVENYDIGINASGIEYDGFLESDEHANTWGHPPDLRRQLDFPSGPGRETLTSQYFQVQAIPGSVGDDFQFTVQGHYSVSYS